MSQPTEFSRSRSPRILNIPLALSLLTALVAAGTVTLHLVGDVMHRQYLLHWGINSSLFPKSTGFVLDSSPSHIAIFDTQLQRARVVVLDKLEVVATRSPKSKEDVQP